MKFAFIDRGDWRSQIYLSLMKDLADHGHDVIIFTPKWSGRWADRPRLYFSQVAEGLGVKVSTQKVAIKQGYTVISDQDFLRRTTLGRRIGFRTPKESNIPWTRAEVEKLYESGGFPFKEPVIAFGYFKTGTSFALSFAYPVDSLYIGDYENDYEDGPYYFGNWSFIKHALSKISKAKARKILGIPQDIKVFSMFHEHKVSKGQMKAIASIAAVFKKRGYFTVLKTKGKKIKRVSGVDKIIRDMVTKRPRPVAIEICKASDALYSYVRHGPSNLARTTGVPYIVGREGGTWGGHEHKAMPIGELSPKDPLAKFRSLAPKFRHTYEQFMEVVERWQNQIK